MSALLANRASQPFAEVAEDLLSNGTQEAAWLVSPRMAQAWAACIVAYWSRLVQQGGLDPTQPLYVLDLSPPGGVLATGLLQALVDGLRAHGLHEWPVCYLLCQRGDPQQQAIPAALLPFERSGLLQSARWDARTGKPLMVGQDRLPLFGVRNPVVVVAACSFGVMPAQWYASHQGQLWRGHAALAPASDGEPGEQELHVQWQDDLAPAQLSSGEALLLDHYRVGLPSAGFVLSEGALAMLDAVADFSTGRYLLLAADHGVSLERQIRAHALAPPQRLLPGALRLPVNFHALALHQRMNGAAVALEQRHDDGWVLHLACRDDKLGLDSQAFAAWRELLRQAHPDDRGHDCSALPWLALEVQASAWDHVLRRSACDPLVLQTLLNSLGDELAIEHDGPSAAALSESLMRAWSNALEPQRQAALAQALAGVLMNLQAWGLARQVLEQCSAAQNCAPQADLLLLRAMVEQNTGHSRSASTWAQRALQREPEHAVAQAVLCSVQARLARWHEHSWCLEDAMRDEVLCLELMDEGHAQALARQLRDPQIGQQARLPWGAEAEDGLHPEPNSDEVELAVMHHEHGLVGGVGFSVHRDAAYFHLWIGTDHQGRALAGSSLELLLRLLRSGGIAHAFTSVDPGNERCQRVLKRLGFATLAPVGEGEAVPLLHLHRYTDARVAALPERLLWQRLRGLCEWLERPRADAQPDTPDTGGGFIHASAAQPIPSSSSRRVAL